MKYFGTDGFRGEANKELTAEHALKVGQYLGWYFGERLRIKASCVIGKDTRRSSYMLEYALAAGVASSGADVNLMHVTTTPSVSYIARTCGFDFGIMVTASHNPFYDNGIKVVNRYGSKLSDNILEEVEAYIDGDIEVDLSETAPGACKDFLAGRNRYISYLTSVPMGSFRGYKVGLDLANGAASTIAINVFDMLGAETYVINGEPNGTNINDDCGSTHMLDLCTLVKEKNLDIGFAFDGDADRCIAVDNEGQILDGDAIVYIIATNMKEKGNLLNDSVVVSVMSNAGLIESLKEKGINCVVTDVGDKNVSVGICQNRCSLGAEQNGHVILSKYSLTGDGILTAIVLMEILIQKKTLSSALTHDLKIYPQKIANVAVEDKDAVVQHMELQALVDEMNAMLSVGRVLIRKSCTEPVVRVLAEAENEYTCDAYVNKLVAEVKRSIS